MSGADDDHRATCRAVGCQHAVRPGHLMCHDHWHMVPAPLQRDVWTRWRELRSAHRRSAAAARQALRPYALSVKAAIEAVHAKQLARRAEREASTPPLF